MTRFSLYYSTDRSWVRTKAKLAFMLWKAFSVDGIVSDCHKERSSVLLNGILERLVRPQLNHGYKAIANRHPRTFKLNIMGKIIHKSIQAQLAFVLHSLSGLKKADPLKPWQDPAKKELLRRTGYKAGVYTLQKKSLDHYQCIKFASFIRWKGMRGEHLENSM
jgi:hypothetical protein